MILLLPVLALFWLIISYRIQFKVLLIVYKGLLGFAPLYISDNSNLDVTVIT